MLGRFSPDFGPGTESANARVDLVPVDKLLHGRFEFSIVGSGNTLVRVERSLDLRHWEMLDELPLNGATRYQDRQATDLTRAFYRLRTEKQISRAFGFLILDALPGHNIFGYPFCHPSHRLAEILHWMPDGCQVSSFDPNLYKISTCTYKNGRWSNPDVLIQNGEGFLLYNPTAHIVPVTLAGYIPESSKSLELHSGVALRSSMFPVNGHLENDLRIPLNHGETVTLYFPERQEYVEYKKEESGWNRELPNVRYGEGFWIAKQSATTWKQNSPHGFDPGGN